VGNGTILPWINETGVQQSPEEVFCHWINDDFIEVDEENQMKYVLLF